MTATALARKYRSRNFDELIGQSHVVKALSHALTTGRLHHAYLLTGTRGVGKTTIARILAKCLNCETGVTAKPCGVCSTCVSVEQGRFVDLLELDAASNTGVDDMREIIENARYAPTSGRYKVYLIDEVHMLSKNAFNAMLKTLEEPPEHVKFVLATTDPQKIPVTVLSRCLQFNLKQLPPDLIEAHLVDVLTKENVAHDAQAVQLISRAAAGSMRDALSITDQAIAFGHGKLEAEQVRSMLGVVDSEYVLRIAAALARNDGPAILAEIDVLHTRSVSFDSVLQEMGLLFHDIALKQSVPAAQISSAWDVADLVGAFSPETVQVLYQIALTGRRDLSLAPDERAGLTMALLRMLAFVPASGEQIPAAPSSPPLPRGEGLGVRAAPPERKEKPLRAVGPSVSVMPGSAGADQSQNLQRRDAEGAEGLEASVDPVLAARDDSSLQNNSSQNFDRIAPKNAETAPQVLGHSSVEAHFLEDRPLSPWERAGVREKSLPPNDGSRNALPHPSPLPKGEGTNSAAPEQEKAAAIQASSITNHESHGAAGTSPTVSRTLAIPDSPTLNFDGDWPALIARLPLVALTREFARNTALIKQVGNTFYVNLPDTKRPLIKHQAKLKDILIEFFGKPVRLEVELGELNAIAPQVQVAALPTLAKQETAERSEKKRKAEEEFVASPFVQTLVREAGAIVHLETIQPLE
jgi:DNA polymerase III subunit gamma/tau